MRPEMLFATQGVVHLVIVKKINLENYELIEAGGPNLCVQLAICVSIACSVVGTLHLLYLAWTNY